MTSLDNGIRVASEPGGGETATVGVFINSGSRYDQKPGVAHFLEHLFFKGTTRRTRVELEQEIENIGGHLNAYTSREMTVFYSKVLKKDVPQALDILSDILQNSTFSQDAVVRERETIERESEEIERNMEETIYDKLHYTAFRGSTLGSTILGPVSSIRTMNSDDIKTYVDTHYTGPRMVVVGTGAITHQQLHDLTNKHFASIPYTPRNGKKVVLPPAQFIGSDVRQREDGMPLAHVALGFETCGYNDPDSAVLWVLQQLLGTWNRHGPTEPSGVFSTSRLVSAVSHQDLANSISTFNTQYTDTGLFGVYTTAQAVGLEDLYYTITKEMTRLCYSADPELIQEAKAQLLFNLLHQMDGSTLLCEEIGREILNHGRRIHPAEVVGRIHAVDAAAVRAAANRFFYDRDHALAAMGPIHELPDYGWLRRRSYWLRY